MAYCTSFHTKPRIPNVNYFPVWLKVSRPGSFTPASLRTVREPLDSYRSRHPGLRKDPCLRTIILPPMRLLIILKQMTPALRSTSITEASSLLRPGPPLNTASILSASMVLILGLSLSIGIQLPMFPMTA